MYIYVYNQFVFNNFLFAFFSETHVILTTCHWESTAPDKDLLDNLWVLQCLYHYSHKHLDHSNCKSLCLHHQSIKLMHLCLHRGKTRYLDKEICDIFSKLKLHFQNNFKVVPLEGIYLSTLVIEFNRFSENISIFKMDIEIACFLLPFWNNRNQKFMHKAFS